MPADYNIKLQSKDKSIKEFVGNGYKGQYGVKLSINVTKIFKLAKAHPELLKQYDNGDKIMYLFTNINAPDDKKQSSTPYKDNQGSTFTHDDLDDELPF